jgi:acyl-[acyl carrier protein]--UDP-N-acetylglucosamine O-acyltransferase
MDKLLPTHRPTVGYGYTHPTAIIGDPPEHREWLENPTLYHPPKIHETCRINSYCTVDSGLKRATTLGRYCFMMTKSHVGHDALLGAGCELATGVIIGGHAELGDRVRIGVGAMVQPYIKIGTGARIGSGAVVTKDVPPGEVWAGVPAKKMRDLNFEESQFNLGSSNDRATAGRRTETE